jgi:energy-coupling factor transporter ATP-binding protein EcfA2
VKEERHGFSYLLFNRELRSDRELYLLGAFPKQVVSSLPPVTLSVEDNPVEPQGYAVLDEEDTAASIFFDGRNYFFVLNNTGYVAVVSLDGLSIRIHPSAFKPLVSAQVDDAILDRLVTSVLSRIPILWTEPSVHGASLESPGGVVLLLGQSGVGKSTLSQYLVRDSGWVLHDDDAALVTIFDSEPVMVPMGGSARLRTDAALSLETQGKKLDGFAGGKIALQRKTTDSIAYLDLPRLIVEICPIKPSDQQELSSEIKVTTIIPTDAVGVIWDHILTTDLEKKQLALRFEVSRQLANSPLVRVGYTRGTHTPEKVASVIAGFTDTL